MGHELVSYINGEFLPNNQAAVSCFDLAFLRGYGVFDYVMTYNRKLFRLGEHLKRLKNSCSDYGIQMPESEEKIAMLLLSLLSKNLGKELAFRIIVSGGVSNDSLLSSKSPSLFILTGEAPEYPLEWYQKGIHAKTHEYLRPFARCKSLNYGAVFKPLNEARNQGALELLLTDHSGQIYEGSTCNVFGIQNGVLITSDEHVLKGITRKVVLELAGDILPVEFKPIPLDSSLQELFVTSTNREIVPVTKVNGQNIGSGNVGVFTKKLMKAYFSYTSRNQRFETIFPSEKIHSS